MRLVSNTIVGSPLNRFYLGVPTRETVCPIKTKSICLVFIDCNAHLVVVALGWMDGWLAGKIKKRGLSMTAVDQSKSE